MAADGYVVIDTKIPEDGLEKGFQRMTAGMDSVADTAERIRGRVTEVFGQKMPSAVQNSIAKISELEKQAGSIELDISSGEKALMELEANMQRIQEVLNRAGKSYISPDVYINAISEKEVLEASIYQQQDVLQSLQNKANSVYKAIEQSRAQLASAIEREAEREAKAEEKAKKKTERERKKQYRDLMKPAKQANSRLREIVSGALVFNAVGSAVRAMTSYFGQALRTNDEYSKSVAVLRGSLMTAFQPIYQSAVPAIITLVNWLNTAIQVVGRFFSALSGLSYSDMQKNAEALNKQANAIGGVGGAAEEAKKQLMSFDEINKLNDQKSGGGGGGSAINPIFDTMAIPSEIEKVIDSLAMRVKDIFFEWDNLTPEVIAQKLLAALAAIAGGFIGFALGGPRGTLVGMTVGAGVAVLLSNLIFNGDGSISSDEFLASVIAALNVFGGAAIGFALGGPGGALIGATIGLGITFAVLKSTYDDVEQSYDDLAEKIIDWSDRANRTTETGFIIPTHDEMMALNEKIREFFRGSGDDIARSFNKAFRTTETGFVIPTQEEMAATAEWIKNKFVSAKEWITSTWVSLPEWFANKVTGPIVAYFNGLSDAVSLAWDNIVASIADAVNDILNTLGFIFGKVIAYQTTGVMPADGYTESASLYAARSIFVDTPDIPHLARGAVIPPNAPFMAVLGDQKHGTNIEAPLSTIQDAIRAEFGSYLFTTNELLKQILEKDTDIILDGDKVSKTVSKYQRRAARSVG